MLLICCVLALSSPGGWDAVNAIPEPVYPTRFGGALIDPSRLFETGRIHECISARRWLSNEELGYLEGYRVGWFRETIWYRGALAEPFPEGSWSFQGVRAISDSGLTGSLVVNGRPPLPSASDESDCWALAPVLDPRFTNPMR